MISSYLAGLARYTPVPPQGLPPLLHQRLDLRRDARLHILRRMRRLPPDGPRPPAPRAGVRAPPPVRPLCAPKVLLELVGDERRRLGVVRDPVPDEDVPDRLADLVPGVLPAFPEVEAFPAVAGGGGLADDGVEQNDIQVCNLIEIKYGSSVSLFNIWREGIGAVAGGRSNT